MKLRLRANTIRLRLVQSEVARLAAGESIVETLPTPVPFHFAVTPEDVSDLSARFDGHTLCISVPLAWSAAWAASDEVGRHAISNGLDILIEKDWACTTARPGEENLDTYPNPNPNPIPPAAV